MNQQSANLISHVVLQSGGASASHCSKGQRSFPWGTLGLSYIGRGSFIQRLNNTVEPLNKGHTGTLGTVLYREMVPLMKDTLWPWELPRCKFLLLVFIQEERHAYKLLHRINLLLVSRNAFSF